MTNSHLPLQGQLTSLAEELAKRSPPEDIYENHSFLHPIDLRNPSSSYTELLAEHFSKFVGGRNKEAAKELKRHWQFFLLCLSGCAVTHRWLSMEKSLLHGPLVKEIRT